MKRIWRTTTVILLALLIVGGSTAAAVDGIYIRLIGEPTIAAGELIYSDGTNWLDLARGANGTVLTSGVATISWANSTGNSDLTDFLEQTAWRGFYSDAAGDVTELAFGANNTVLTSGGAAIAPTWESPAAAGNIFGTIVSTSGNITADTSSDTAYFWSEGGDIEIIAAPGNDSINFSLSDATYAISIDAQEATADYATGVSTRIREGTYIDTPVIRFPNSGTGGNGTIFLHHEVFDSYTGGTIQVQIKWLGNATSGAAQFNIHTLGIAESEASDQTFGAAEATITDITDGTARDYNYALSSAFSPTWTAGDINILVIQREYGHGSDTMLGYADFVLCDIAFPSER